MNLPDVLLARASHLDALSHRFCNPEVMEPWERRNDLDCMESMPEREFLIFGEFYSNEADKTGFKDMRWLSGDTLLALFEKPLLKQAFRVFQNNVRIACEDVLEEGDGD